MWVLKVIKVIKVNTVIGALLVLRVIMVEEEIRVNKVIGGLLVLRVIKVREDLRATKANKVMKEKEAKEDSLTYWCEGRQG